MRVIRLEGGAVHLFAVVLPAGLHLFFRRKRLL